VLEESTAFLESELRRRGVIRTESLSSEETARHLQQLRADCLRDTSDLDAVLAPASAYRLWGAPEDEWRMQPILMD
jgi:hypothetical protein